MAREIHVTMPNGTVWVVPAAVVERNAADYYAGLGDDPGIQEPMSNDELLDWAANNMDWTDVQESARMTVHAPPLSAEDAQEGWVNGPKVVVGRRR